MLPVPACAALSEDGVACAAARSAALHQRRQSGVNSLQYRHRIVTHGLGQPTNRAPTLILTPSDALKAQAMFSTEIDTA